MQRVLQRYGRGMHYFVVDREEVEHLLEDGNRRVLCRLNGAVSLHSALLPRKEGGFVVSVGKRVCRELNLTIGSPLSVEFARDDSPYQFSVPEELQEVLSTDEEAMAVFSGLTPGNQRGLMSLVYRVKSPDKRVERALRIAESLKKGVTAVFAVLKRDVPD